MRPLKEKVSVSLDLDVIDVIKTKAEDDDRNFSSYINKVLKDHIIILEGNNKEELEIRS
ncbi:MAG: toxin-antitoxin system protein [Lachnospiraceae bacterium]|nr:toxin-antitoxin system protein [Lachnospiraceae bacterium]